MCTMQLHRVVYSDICTKPSLSRLSCRSHVTRSLSRFPSILGTKRNGWGISVEKHPRSVEHVSVRSQKRLVCAAAYAIPFPSKELTIAVKDIVTRSLASVLKLVHESQLFRQCAPAVAVILFAMWGLAPLLRVVHRAVLHEEDSSWKDSQMRYILLSFVRPLLLWVGVIFVCRAFDPLILSTAASQAIKQRFLNFARSFSTVLAFAQCSLSLTQQLQKMVSGGQSSQDSRSFGAQFVNNAVYTAVWVAAVCLFMELLGFSTQRWLTAGGLGTVLITLAGREIFTNFLSSIMIHATRPFILNEWIQTKIDGYEVSGTVEHVGWWSPTIVRGDDREAVHIPNHKFTVSVVRNLSQKSHWRIKTHFGISHLDVSKVPNIVADMRKVLAKHPQVEQRKLHRRVFFDFINPENQAIMVLVSCFVKTPHFEEYLRVKEVILVDLLKVISHHHARLATPIRSVQRIQEDIEARTSPYRDINRSTESQGRPYLLVETTAVSSGSRDTESNAMKNGVSSSKENAAGADTTDSGSNIESSESPTDSKVPGKHKPQLEGLDSMGLNSKDITLLGAAFEKPPARIPESSDDAGQLGDKVASKFSAETPSARQDKVHNNKTTEPFLQVGSVKSEKGLTRSDEISSQPSGQKIEKGMSKAAVDLEAAPLRENNGISSEETNKRESQVPPRNENNDSRLDTQRSQAMVQGSTAKLDTDTHRSQGTVQGSMAKLDTDRGQSAANSPASKGPLEENLVLGVALDGPKRTLPLNEVDSVTDQKELVASRNGNSSSVKERRDGTHTTGLNSPDTRER